MYNFGSYTLKIKWVVADFHQIFLRAVRVIKWWRVERLWAFSTRKRDVTKQRMRIFVIKVRGRQFTANFVARVWLI